MQSPERYIIEEIIESTETRYPIPEGRGYRNHGYFIGKGRNIHTNEVVEICPFSSPEEALKRIQQSCNKMN